MADRPILFSAPMVRAILAGTKTQTRRAMRDQPCELLDFNRGRLSIRVRGAVYQAFSPQFPPVRCPYGRPGDRLWVREAWAPYMGKYGRPTYRADPEWQGVPAPRPDGRWRPSIHMPRAASRITLEVVSVRVERLQDISEADSIAEGIERSGECNWRDYLDHPHNDFTSARRSYRSLWDHINGPGAWDANPFVWVVEFKRVEA